MKKSIARVGYFPIITAESGTQTYSDIIWLESKLAGGREYTAEPTGEASELYADGIVVYSAEENTGYNIKLTLLDIIDDISEAWIGFTVDKANKTVAEFGNAAERPRFGLVLVENTVARKDVATYYYDCQVSKRPSDKGKTTEGKFEVQFAEIEISARPRLKDTLVKFKQSIDTLPTKVAEPTAITPPDET